MKTLKFCCHALSIGIAVAVLAGCGESRSVAPQLPATSVQARVVAKHMKAPSYTIIDVGTLGGTFSEAVGVNDQGGVSGYSTLPSDTVIHAFYRHDSVMTDLGTLGGPNSYSPEAGNPNDRSEVAGMSDTSTYDQYSDNFCGLFDFQSTSPYICNAFVWRHRSMKALPTLGGPNGCCL